MVTTRTRMMKELVRKNGREWGTRRRTVSRRRKEEEKLQAADIMLRLLLLRLLGLVMVLTRDERISYGSLFDIDLMNFDDKEVAEKMASREQEEEEEGW
jgi:hypothetical protein